MQRSNPTTPWNDQESMPTIGDNSYIDPTASIIGDVRIGKYVYVAPMVSIRADEATPIVIGDMCNVQDGAVFHGLKGSSILLGSKISIAHGAIVHGPMNIGDESFVGFNAVVHASTIGTRCFVGHGALVIGVTLYDGIFVPPGTVVDSSKKAEALGSVPDSLKGFNEEVVEVNCEFAKMYNIMDKSCRVRKHR